MLSPVGKHPPAVYWRRRLMFIVLPAVLVLLMIVYLFSGNGGSKKKAATSSVPTLRAASSAPSGAAPALTAAPTPSGAAPTGTGLGSPASAASAAPVRLCSAADLRIQAATGKPSFVVGTHPDLYLVVTDISPTPCRRDLADKQIELVVNIGSVRVWGSHDCKIEPGVDIALLKPRIAVRREIVWAGETSAAQCPDNRYVAAAGEYQLVASLAGQSSPPVSFEMTASG